MEYCRKNFWIINSRKFTRTNEEDSFKIFLFSYLFFLRLQEVIIFFTGKSTWRMLCFLYIESYCGKLSGNWVKREDFEWEPLKHSFALDTFLMLHCTSRCWRIYGDGTCNGSCIQEAITLAARHGSEWFSRSYGKAAIASHLATR